MIQIAAIVDAYSTGAALPSEFRKYGVPCVHVQTSDPIPESLAGAYISNDFLANLVAPNYDSTRALATALSGWDLLCVVPGTETGVNLADELASILRLPGNDPNTSRLRRDKFFMHEALRGAGLSNLEQARCSTSAEAIAWAEAGARWPLVAKPAASAGADHVKFCYCLEDVRQACDAMLGQVNRLGHVNDTVVLQDRIEGQQYIVNAVSMAGRHFVSEIWKDDKIAIDGAALVSDREILLSADALEYDKLASYVHGVLDALGIREGPSHSELFLTDKGNVLLVETAARMQGTIDHVAVLEAAGHSHVTLTALRYAAPDEFARLIGTRYQKRSNLHCVTLCSTVAGRLRKNRCNDLIGGLQSFQSLLHTPKPGDELFRTTDFFSNPGIVYLAGDDERQLERDYQLIRQWEKRGQLFDIDPIDDPDHQD